MKKAKLNSIPDDESGGGRKLAVMTEMFPTLQLGQKWPNTGNTPVQWVAKNRSRDMERHYMQRIEDLTKALEDSVALQAHYAKLLNVYDGGERTIFKDANMWLTRLEELYKHNSSVMCEHANEVPAVCKCSKHCYCKKHTCKTRK